MYNRLKSFLPILPLIFILVFFLVKSTNSPYSDFAGYYFGGKELLAGNYEAAYDTYTLNQKIVDQGFTGIYASYTPFPPITALFFSPFYWLSLDTSKLIFNIISCLLFLFSVYRVGRIFKISPEIFILLPFIFFVPIRSNILFGQSYFILFALLMEGFIAYRKEKYILSSFLWSIAIVFKIFPILILFFLFIKKKYKIPIYILIISATLIAASLLFVGFPSWKYYLMSIMPRVGNGELNDSFTFMFQSAFMLFKKLFIYDQLLNPLPLLNSSIVFVLLISIFNSVILTGSVLITRSKTNELFQFGIWILVSILISPNGSTYSLILLAMPFMGLAIAKGEQISHITFYGLSLILLLAFNLPVALFSNLPIPLQFPRLYLLLLFFFLPFFDLGFTYNFRLSILLLLVFILLNFGKIRKEPDASKYLLNREEHLLIYNYGVSNGELFYNYWNGVASKPVYIKGISIESFDNNIFIRNGQLVYQGKQITDSKDQKKLPAVINGKYVLYLSDKNRGVGFYTLRKLDLPQEP